MQLAQRQTFKTSQDWNNFLVANKQLSGQDLFQFIHSVINIAV